MPEAEDFATGPKPDPGWEDAPVKLETRGKVAVAWLDRPPANSISPEMATALSRAWKAVLDGDIRCLVIASNNPKLFCAGADIKAFAGMHAEAGGRLAAGMHALLREMERSSVITIAAVNAIAFGGGCELAMACDIRLAAESARFGQPEVKLGLIPGFGGTVRLPRLIGEARALEMNLSGDPIDAATAERWGLANRLVPDADLMSTALAWAERCAGAPARAVGQIKRLAAVGEIEAALDAEQRAFAEIFGSSDAREGIAAFLEKRPAAFTGS